MLNKIDREYAEVCINYIKEWIMKYEVEDWEISQEIMEYIITKGGDGIRDLEKCFYQVIATAKEYQITKIDKKFVDTVISSN